MPKRAVELGPLDVRRLKGPGLHFVGGVAGLALQITDAGSRSWILRMTVGGRRRDMGLGAYPDVTLAMAREDAKKARADVRQGVDPIEGRRAAQSALRASKVAALTFQQAAEAYMTVHAPTWRSAKHQQQWRNTLETYAYPVLGNLLVRDVAKEHVLAVLRPIWTTKIETASRLRSRMELVLGYAMQAGYRPEGLNPARWRGGLDKLLPPPAKVARVEHHQALPLQAVGAFMARLRGEQGMGARALEFAILTAARSGEVRGASWSEIDLDGAVWVIPAARMKAAKEHRVPLSVGAIGVLKAIPQVVDLDLVFPSRRGGPLSDMTLAAVLRRMDVPAVPHGFRSTFRDWAAERTAHPRELAEMALAHAIESKVEAAYRRGDMLERRRAMMGEWAVFLGYPAIARASEDAVEEY
ncbi:MAG: integrase arm-type DNA-binding domain-containing protein [Zoogloea sp.]|nr:integrase arm-type DNA-binding domain-containing protein [Zoogloea sp.]